MSEQHVTIWNESRLISVQRMYQYMSQSISGGWFPLKLVRYFRWNWNKLPSVFFMFSEASPGLALSFYRWVSDAFSRRHPWVFVYPNLCARIYIFDRVRQIWLESTGINELSDKMEASSELLWSFFWIINADPLLAFYLMPPFIFNTSSFGHRFLTPFFWSAASLNFFDLAL